MTDPNTDPRQIVTFDIPGAPPSNYAPAVRVGNSVFVAGMIAMKDGEIVGQGDIAIQTKQVIENIRVALEAAGATLEDIVRHRIYLTDIDDLAIVRKELAPVFGRIRPAGTLVAVSSLVHPDLKIEIDVDAIIGSAFVQKP